MAKVKAPPPIPLESLGNGLLFRAIVSLPDHMCESGNLFQERIVFFEAPYIVGERGRHLEKLLSTAWYADTRNWLENGTIYNLCSSHELRENAFGPEGSGDLRLFEVGGGQGGIGPDRIHYARLANIDLFVTPKVARCLRSLSEQIEALYAKQQPQEVAA